MDNYSLRCESIINRFYPMLVGSNNIYGVGMGYKTINGNTTDVPCLKFFVPNKISESSLPKNKIIPRFFNGILTDVVSVGNATDCLNTTSQNIKTTAKDDVTNPARGGELIYNKTKGGPIGTFACALTEKETQGKEVFLLSTARILTANYQSKESDSPQKIYQKATNDPKSKERDIADLDSAKYVHLVSKDTKLDPTLINEVDVAIAYSQSTIKEGGGKYDFKDESEMTVMGGMWDLGEVAFIKDLQSVLQKKPRTYILSKYSGVRGGDIECPVFSGSFPVGNKIAHFKKQYLISMINVQTYDYGSLIFVKQDTPSKKHLVLGMIIGHCGDINSGKLIVTPIDSILLNSKKFIYYYKDKHSLV